MKKTMVALAALVSGLMAFGDNQLPADNKEDFSEAAKGSTITVGADSFWAWSGTAAIADVATVVGDDEPRALEIKTGADVLSRKLQKSGEAMTSANVFFDAKIDFRGEAVDAVPTLAADAKLAIFALDNADLGATTPSTALYALASDLAGGKKLYRLGDGSITSGVHRVTVKAYANVMNGSTPNSAFKVYVDETNATITASYPVAADGSVTWTDDFNASTYLKRAVLPVYDVAETRVSLLVGLVSGTAGQPLSAWDFNGNARIQNIEIAEWGARFPFIVPDPDAAMKLSLTDVEVTEVTPSDAIDAEGNILDSCTFTVATTNAEKQAITWSYDGTAANVTCDYKTFTVTREAVKTLTISATAAQATVDGKSFATFGEALADANKSTAGNPRTLTLLADVTDANESQMEIKEGADVILDLNGHAFKGCVNYGGALIFVSSNAKLTVRDSQTASANFGYIRNLGSSDISYTYCIDVWQYGTLVIESGAIMNKINNGGTVTTTGGDFWKDAFAYASDIPGRGDRKVVSTKKSFWDFWTVLPDAPTVEPGKPVVVEADSAEAATNAVKVAATSPDKDIVSDEDYTAYFMAKATPVPGESGKYSVSAELRDEIVKAAAETAELANALGDVASGTKTSVDLSTARPGLYYSVKYTNAVGSIASAAETAREMADKDGGVTLDLSTKLGTGDMMFYRILVSTTDVK